MNMRIMNSAGIFTDLRKLGEIVMQWKDLPYDKLVREIDAISGSGNHWEFVRTVYPLIQDPETKQKVNETLLKIAEEYSCPSSFFDLRMRAVYLCAKLKLPGIEKIILNYLRTLEDPANIKNRPPSLGFLNTAIRDLRIEEASDFLIKELNVFLSLDDSERERYWHLTGALYALDVIKPELADYYRSRIGWRRAYKTVSEWNQLNCNELKEEIEKNILGMGMEGSTRFYSFIPEYYEQIKDHKLKKRVDKILLELIDNVESGVGGRMIYVCSRMELEGIREKVRRIAGKSDYLFGKIEQASEARDWNCYIEYITELNDAIGRLNMVELKDFLLKQLSSLRQPPPPPLTKEYYLHYMCARSALKALKQISPELVKGYKVE